VCPVKIKRRGQEARYKSVTIVFLAAHEEEREKLNLNSGDAAF
jgi:hypothetical protein